MSDGASVNAVMSTPSPWIAPVPQPRSDRLPRACASGTLKSGKPTTGQVGHGTGPFRAHRARHRLEPGHRLCHRGRARGDGRQGRHSRAHHGVGHRRNCAGEGESGHRRLRRRRGRPWRGPGKPARHRCRPERRYSRQQRRHLQFRCVRGGRRRGLVALLPDQRDERNSHGAALPSRHARATGAGWCSSQASPGCLSPPT